LYRSAVRRPYTDFGSFPAQRLLFVEAASVGGLTLLFDRQIHGQRHPLYRTRVPFKLCGNLPHWSGVAHQPDQCLLLGFSPLFRGDPAMMI